MHSSPGAFFYAATVQLGDGMQYREWRQKYVISRSANSASLGIYLLCTYKSWPKPRMSISDGISVASGAAATSRYRPLGSSRLASERSGKKAEHKYEVRARLTHSNVNVSIKLR